MNNGLMGFPHLAGIKKRNVLALRGNGVEYKNDSLYPIFLTGYTPRGGNAGVTTHYMTVDGDIVDYWGFGQSGAGGPAQTITLKGIVPAGSSYVMYSSLGFAGMFEYYYEPSHF